MSVVPIVTLWFRPKQSKSNIERCLRYQDKLWHLQASLAQLRCQGVVTVQTVSIIVIFTRQGETTGGILAPTIGW